MNTEQNKINIVPIIWGIVTAVIVYAILKSGIYAVFNTQYGDSSPGFYQNQTYSQNTKNIILYAFTIGSGIGVWYFVNNHFTLTQ